MGTEPTSISTPETGLLTPPPSALEQAPDPVPLAEAEAAAAQPDPALGAVVVGVDGSDTSQTALTWAAAEAVRRGLGLHVICAREAYVGALTSFEGFFGLPEFDDDDSPRVIEEMATAVRRANPDLRVTTATPYGRPARHLIEASASAAMVVVGNRGKGRLSAALLGTTSLQTVSHAHCPVVVIRQPTAHPGASMRVVVGVDGSAPASEAVQFAFESAGAHGSVEVVHAWWLEVVDGVVVTTEGSPEWLIVAGQHEALVHKALDDLPRRYPDVTVTTRVARAHAADLLSTAAAEADLLVVSNRGRGGFAGLLLGSVSQRVLEAAQCPVAVTRAV